MKLTSRIVLALVAAVGATTAAAQNSPPRGGKWEFTLQPQYTHGQSFDSGNGSSGTVNSALGFGFGVGYNLNNHLNLGGDFFWNSANYNATVAGAGANAGASYNVNGVMATDTIRFNATWNFFASDFTPFVIGGIGSTYVDSNIPNGPTTPVCWYDPWYGYYCGSYVPTKAAYFVSYSAGAGLRWEVDRNIFLRAVAIRQWIDGPSAVGTVFTDQYRFDVGFKF